MGMFDTLLLTCPHCGKTTHEQSKADECVMQYYTLESAPLSIIGDLANQPLTCDHCEGRFMLQVEFKTNIVALGGIMNREALEKQLDEAIILLSQFSDILRYQTQPSVANQGQALDGYSALESYNRMAEKAQKFLAEVKL